MTTPRSIEWGDSRVEYLKNRGVLRLTSGARSGDRELTVGAFCDELGIDAQPVTVPIYLLFAGTELPPAGGCRDLVATYLCPEEARREFAARRREAQCVWAELIRLAAGRTSTVCWFGVERADGRRYERRSLAAPSRRRRWMRRAGAGIHRLRISSRA